MSKDLEGRQQVQSPDNVQFSIKYKDEDSVFYLTDNGKPEEIIAKHCDQR